MAVAWSFVNTVLSAYQWLANHFNYSENILDINKGPNRARTSVNLDSPNYPSQLADLAAHPMSQSNLPEAEEDAIINHALRALYIRPESEHTAEDSVNKYAQLAVLIAALNSRFNAHNNPRDFEKATYIAVEWAFWIVDRSEDTDEGCALAHKSLAILDSQDKLKYFSEIGLAFENRLEHSMSPSKHLQELHLAFHFGQLAIEDMPDSHAEKPRYAANLQRSITMRKTVLRGSSNLDERIDRRRMLYMVLSYSIYMNNPIALQMSLV